MEPSSLVATFELPPPQAVTDNSSAALKTPAATLCNNFFLISYLHILSISIIIINIIKQKRFTKNMGF
jgi:hypothetical protein